MVIFGEPIQMVRDLKIPFIPGMAIEEYQYVIDLLSILTEQTLRFFTSGLKDPVDEIIKNTIFSHISIHEGLIQIATSCIEDTICSSRRRQKSHI